MNTDILAVVVTDAVREAERALDQVQALFEGTEAVLSRFLPDSDLSRLNRSGGRPFAASPLLLRAVSEALAAACTTEGLFDPTVLRSLIAAGYDRSFDLLDPAGSKLVPAAVAQGPFGHGVPGPATPGAASGATGFPTVRTSASWRDVILDVRAGTITLPPGVGLDLGGIGKGWTIDRAAELLRTLENFVVDAGGDIYLAGTQANGSLWTVGIESPFDRGSDLAVLALRDRAVATSTTSRRRWQREGLEQHHIIDPRTGQPARSGVVSATVVAERVARAEVLAKAALLLGPEEGLDYLAREEGAEGVLVLEDGSLASTEGFREVLHGA